MAGVDLCYVFVEGSLSPSIVFEELLERGEVFQEIAIGEVATS